MSGYSKNGRTTAGKVVFDWYKILQISPSSTPKEIKSAYYKIAQSAHPDKHKGCSQKLEQFKRINEAYDVLSNPTKRNEYDMQMGHHHHHYGGGGGGGGKSSYQRRTNVPNDYRKVYTSRPPPEWKMVWDHTKHYEMHYGDGFQKEAMKQAIKNAEQDGTFIYHSSLGKGFTFHHHLHDHSTSTVNGSQKTNTNHNHGATTNSMNYNPYSKNKVQGPPKIIFDYQEITQNYGGDGSSNKRQNILKHERIVYDLHLRRYERYREEVHNETQQQKNTTTQQQNASDTTTTTTTAAAAAAGTETTSSTKATTSKKSTIYSRYDWRHRQEQQQQDSFLSSMNMFSSLIAATTIILKNGEENKTEDSSSTTTNDGHDASNNYKSNTYHSHKPKEIMDSTAKNSSCIIM